MPKHYLNFSIPFLILFRNSKAHAFDPFTIAATSQVIQSAMNHAEDAAETGFALTDLFSEFGIETDSEKDLTLALERLGKINNQAQELKSNSDELTQSINQDLKNGQSLTSKIKALRQSIRVSKQIASLMGVRPKAAEKVARIQEISLESKMLEELESIRRGQYLSYLENREAKLKREVFLRSILENEHPLRNTP